MRLISVNQSANLWITGVSLCPYLRIFLWNIQENRNNSSLINFLHKEQLKFPFKRNFPFKDRVICFVSKIFQKRVEEKLCWGDLAGRKKSQLKGSVLKYSTRQSNVMTSNMGRTSSSLYFNTALLFTSSISPWASNLNFETSDFFSTK